MAAIGQQILTARKAKGMTQDALSKELNISRSAVAHWETGRTIPDAEMLLRLSKVLDYSFEEEAAKTTVTAPQAEAPADGGSPTGSEVDVPSAGREDISQPPATKSAKRRRAVVVAAASAILCVCLALLLIPRGGKKNVGYSTEDGTVYTIEQFQRETPREDGKAWLEVEKVIRIQSNEGIDMWMYDFVFHERNGVGMKIDSLEVCHFVGDKAHARIFGGSAIEEYGMEGTIAPHGEWQMTGGLPVQDAVKGVGITLTGTDDNGETLSFSAYLSFDIA